jgi:putative ABC transport system permease protein
VHSKSFLLGLIWLTRSLKQGEAFWLSMVILLASFSLTLVGQVKLNTQSAMFEQTAECLLADRQINASSPLPESLIAQAQSLGLNTSMSLLVVSMLSVEDRFELARIEGIDGQFPLRARQETAQLRALGQAQPPQILLDEDFAQRLHAQSGQMIRLGQTQVMTGIGSLNACGLSEMSGFMPRAFVAQEVIHQAGLLGPGARSSYRLYLSGSAPQLAAWDDWLSAYQAQTPQASEWEIISRASMQNDLGKTLDNALIFLDLAALTTLLIGGLSLLISSRLQLSRWIKTLQLMRAMGASAGQIRRVMAAQILGLGLIYGLAGGLLGLLAMWGLMPLLQDFLGDFEPQYDLLNALLALGLTLFTLLSFTGVAFVQSQSLTLKGDLRGATPRLQGLWGALAVGYLGIVLMTAWMLSGGVWLSVVLGLSGLILLLALMAQAGVWVLVRVQSLSHGLTRLSIAQLLIEKDLLKLQIIALGGIGFLLLLLSQVKDQLMDSWQASLSDTTPNVFMTNIETFELPDLTATLTEQVSQLTYAGVIRGRLIEKAGEPFSGEAFPAGRLRNLANREANIALMRQRPEHNPVVAIYQGPRDAEAWPVSVEQGIAKEFGIALGDRLVFQINGAPVMTQVIDFRQVSWQSLKLNFFFILPTDKTDFLEEEPPSSDQTGPLNPAQHDPLAVSYIANFYVASHQTLALQKTLRDLTPGALFIDVSKQMAQIRLLMQQAGDALMVIFYLALIASLLVVFSAIEATSRARWQGWWLLKVFGAPIGAIRRVAHAEFILLGLLAGSLASLLAQWAAQVIAWQVLEIHLSFSMSIWWAGLGGTVLLVWGISAWHLEKSLRLSPHALAQKIKGTA